MRVLGVSQNGLTEVGGYLAEDGSNFWGVEAYRKDGHTCVLGSDRDHGLFVFATTRAVTDRARRPGW